MGEREQKPGAVKDVVLVPFAVAAHVTQSSRSWAIGERPAVLRGCHRAGGASHVAAALTDLFACTVRLRPRCERQACRTPSTRILLRASSLISGTGPIHDSSRLCLHRAWTADGTRHRRGRHDHRRSHGHAPTDEER
ncbi:hypothetical protein E3O18_10410 [Cryobacterium sp. TMT2-42-4]|nr:hypothetical protein E3O18_10410 [Cryobacterium sp. TMT2-42-4]